MKCSTSLLLVLSAGMATIVNGLPVVARDRRAAAPGYGSYPSYGKYGKYASYGQYKRVAEPTPVDYGNYGDYGDYADYGTYPEGSNSAPVNPPAGGYGTYSDYGAYSRAAEAEVEAGAKERRDAAAEPEPAPITYTKYGNYGKYGKYASYGTYPRAVEEAE